MDARRIFNSLYSLYLFSSLYFVCSADLKFPDQSPSQNPCLAQPYSADCKSLVRLCRGPLNESSLDALYDEVRVLAARGQICSPECPTERFALGISCLADGAIPTLDGDCASCVACTAQEPKDFCAVFCPSERGCLDSGTTVAPTLWWRDLLIALAVVVIAIIGLATFIFIIFKCWRRASRPRYSQAETGSQPNIGPLNVEPTRRPQHPRELSQMTLP